jgi:UDP-3-O-[3-hydroxymyristoyl] glucosamine N-acyltransferase
MQIAANDIARLTGGLLEGDAEATVNRPGRIEEGGEGVLTFLANTKYAAYAYSTPVTAILIPQDFLPAGALAARAVIRVPDVYEAMRMLMERFASHPDFSGAGATISQHASIAADSRLGEQVSVGPYAVIESGARVGNHSNIHAQVYIGKDVVIGKHCTLFPGVRVLQSCVIGDHCVLHANAVIGSDGFGYVRQEDGSYLKLPQLGNVVLEDQVEVGANTTVDRASIGSTILRRGVKLDNLVMVAHNVEVGSDTVIAAQAGIAGSTKIGRHCRVGGQAGFVGHIAVADGTQVQAQSGVAATIKEPGQAVYGSPAIGYADYLRSYAVFKKLPAWYRLFQSMQRTKDQKG